MTSDSIEFCKSLPKIELHAHLNGSLSEETLKELGCLDSSILEYKSFSILNNKNRGLQECFVLFDVAQKATRNTNSVYLATKSVIDEFAEDNVIYLELRTTPRSEENMSKQEYIEAVLRAINDNKRDIIVKLILSINRQHDVADSQDSLDVILKMRKLHPDIIRGIDLSGNPHEGKFDEKVFRTAKELGLNTAIHCAEIRNDKEVEEILQFCPDRLGHGTFIHPSYGGTQKNWELYCSKKIPLECCLTSNVICMTSKGYQEHHIQEWITNNLPFSINTDDKGVFGTSLSKEYKYVMQTFNLSQSEMWNISYNSIDQSFASSDEKRYMKRKLEAWKHLNAYFFN